MQHLLSEFDHENQSTRKILERVPEEHFDWQPHAKSYTLRKLATHVGTMPWWATITIGQNELDLAAPRTQQTPSNRAELLATFDSLAAEAREHIANLTPAQLEEPWTLRSGDHVIVTMPKGAALRSFCFNHNVHHRGQLSVYLRLLDVPVPGMYGPSADER